MASPPDSNSFTVSSARLQPCAAGDLGAPQFELAHATVETASRALLRGGADSWYVDHRGFTALDWAEHNGYAEVLKVFKEEVNDIAT